MENLLPALIENLDGHLYLQILLFLEKKYSKKSIDEQRLNILEKTCLFDTLREVASRLGKEVDIESRKQRELEKLKELKTQNEGILEQISKKGEIDGKFFNKEETLLCLKYAKTEYEFGNYEQAEKILSAFKSDLTESVFVEA